MRKMCLFIKLINIQLICVNFIMIHEEERIKPKLFQLLKLELIEKIFAEKFLLWILTKVRYLGQLIKKWNNFDYFNPHKKRFIVNENKQNCVLISIQWLFKTGIPILWGKKNLIKKSSQQNAFLFVLLN